MRDLRELSSELLHGQNFSFLAMSTLDFKSDQYDSFCLKQDKKEVISQEKKDVIFDLASLTKPLSLGLFFLIHAEEKLPEQFELLLDHRAGLPSWGLLSSVDWKAQLLSYPVNESDTCYSDFSALRLMLEVEKHFKQSFESIVYQDWKLQLNWWKALEKKTQHVFPSTGMRAGKEIEGEVHDPNSYNINQFCTHAGLFSDIESLSATLLHLNDKYHLLKIMKQSMEKRKTRFIHAWDTPTGENSLAGSGRSPFTFGHLGFTGTSIWIDCEKMLGHIILTNATEKYWYEREGLQKLRRRLAQEVWSIR